MKIHLAFDIATLDRIANGDRERPGYRWQDIAPAESQKNPKPMT
jgi:hypothetical protein